MRLWFVFSRLKVYDDFKKSESILNQIKWYKVWIFARNLVFKLFRKIRLPFEFSRLKLNDYVKKYFKYRIETV